MNLQTMIVNTRLILKDLNLKKVADPQLVAAANEGKNELVKLIRGSMTEFFVTNAAGTITNASPPNASTVALPADFSQLKAIQVTQAGYEQTEFLKWDRNDIIFQYNLRTTYTWTSTVQGRFYYDFVGKSTIHLSPATSSTFTCQIYYVQEVADLAVLTDSPSQIPSEHHDFIVTWMVGEALRSIKDEREALYVAKLASQAASIAETVKTRELNEPQAGR